MASSAASGFLGRSSNNNSNMRGLVQFIADLRNARARDLEEKRINKELANIRQKFKDGNLSGYHKKKYVCKLLYIYILGWNVDFGHLEAVNLISANKYSEKQIGYLAMTLFLHEKHELLHLVVNSIRKDLLDHNELFNCLALHAIANVGGREMGEALSGEVHRLLISPTSKAFVKKKAALTLLRLYRKHPDIMQPQWAERIISLMDDADLGVALSVTSLVMAVAQDNPDQYKGAYVKAAARLKRMLVDGDFTNDYLYYKVPCPWIQVKLLRLLQYFSPSEDSHVREMIRESLQKILNLAMESNKNVQQNNAQNAVLFEAINLIIHLDTEHALMKQISSRLGRFITSRETNVRYLGLEAMTHLAARAENLGPIKQHQEVILGSLKDRDISVRRKGLDLLYSMCDSTNSGPIVAELLQYLQNADFAIREEMALKIAILTEKYATDIQWYINVSLRLVAVAGDHLSDEVWQRVIQIVTNNEELQVYAAKNTLQHVKQDHCHETLVKIGAYILGEFGHLIAEDKGCSPIEQFMALSGKLSACSPSTRAMILSSFIKFVNLFPEIKPQLLHVFELYSHTLDSELQQRACEYLTLASLPTDDLLRTVCDEMPPFPERQSALLSRLHSKHAGTSDKRTWVVGGKDANVDSSELNMTKQAGLKRAFSSNLGTNGDGAANGTTNGTNGHSNDLAGLDMNAGPTPEKVLKAPNLASAAHLSPGWEPGYNKLLLKADGILFEDGQLQVGVRSEYRGQMACLILYFLNKTPATISSFTTTLDLDDSEKTNLTWDVKSLPESSISQGGQARQVIMFESKKVFSKAPTVRISYLAGALQALTLKLPLTAHKFMDPAELSADDFFKRWKQIGGAPREAQAIIGLANGKEATREIHETFVRKVLQGFRWGILGGVDPNTKNFVGASVLHTSEGGKFGCLLRLEPNYSSQMVRLTIRATDESVPAVLLKLMEQRISAGVSKVPMVQEGPTRQEITDAFSLYTTYLLASKEALLSPDSLRPELPSRRLLFAYQHVFLADRKCTLSPTLVGKKIISQPVTEPNAQPKSIMALKFDRLKDKIRVGWYGLSKDTIAHSAITTRPTATATPVADSHAFVWPTPTASQDELYIRGRETNPPEGIMPTTTTFEDPEEITVVHTVIVTITSIITDTTLETLTTTALISKCTTCVPVGASTNTIDLSTPTEDVMTGIMYCSFTGRRNIYTLCPLVHADSPGMLTSAPAVVSSATPRIKNPFSVVRVAVVSLWNSVLSMGSALQSNDCGGCHCECAGIKKKLDSAVNLVRIQQELLDSQRDMIDEHRKSLFLALETLANLTATKAGEKGPRERQLNLKI
ncbi:hypothetical protein FHL15_004502 [Xylaria flabelliformis]|uniref:Clathrin adaptor alpha/beta/gamma-adaptin appendage Ig-like subdomain domain-containing protein n=1 Tax=Xylaria flabelliformis TaxID=2512241 RepID=A0A553I3F5_9PEZI|nr:hypothetical protein FHL15_004502 [Xylaria flabelliformis]